MYKKWRIVLENCILFTGIESGELNSILECLKPRVVQYKKDEIIATEGDSFTEFGVVLQGGVSIVKESASGNRTIIGMFEEGEMFGEIAAFAGKGKWPSTVIAQHDCYVMFLPPEKIVGECEKMCVGHRLLIVNMLRILSGRAMMLNRKVEYLTIKTIRGKVSAYLLEQYKKNESLIFVLPLNRDELAEFLNVSRPALSREMCQMRDEGIIDFHMSSVRISDIESIEEIVQRSI